MTFSLRKGVLSRVFGRAREHSGFTLIEAVLAMTIFAIVSTALAGVLSSSIGAKSLTTEKTAAEQLANSEIEWVRTIDYANVGVPNGNPKGTVNAAGDQSGLGGPSVPSRYTVTVKVTWVNDPTPTSYASKANYKNVTVSVFRARDGKLLSKQSTQIGPRQRAPFGGIDKGTVDVLVVDFLPPSNPVQGARVNLTTGPSATLSDLTDAAGKITFPSLQPTTSSGPTAFYDLVVPGYTIYPLPASATHFSIAAAQSFGPTTLKIYQPVTLTFQPRNSDGTPFSTASTFTVTGPDGSTGTFTYNQGTGAAINVTSLTKSSTTIPAPPGTYTITSATGMFADPVTVDVPNNLGDYPGDLSGQTSITSDPLGSMSVSVQSAGAPVSGATVTVSGGPRAIPPRSATTNASGVAPAFSGLPAGSGYTVTASKGGQSAPSQSASVSGGSTTNVTMIFPTGDVKAVVTWATLPVSGATVTLSGGPGAISLTGTSAVNGEYVFPNVPVGTGYTLTATRNGQTGTASPAPTVVANTTTTSPIAMPTVSLLATVTWVTSAVVSGATVTLSGGPMSLAAIPVGPTGGSGQVTFSNVPAGGGYTIVATKNGQTTTLTSQTVATSPTTSISVPLPTGTIAVNATTWAGQPVATASVSVSGGPNSPTTYTGTTDASGNASITVPAAGTAYPYTVTVTKTSGSITGSDADPVASLASGATATVTPVLTPTGTIAVNTATWAGQPAGGATVTITGGPNTTATYTGTTNSSGVASVVVPITNSSFPYTVTVTKNGGSGTATVNTVTTSTPGTAAPTLTPTKSLVLTIQRNGTNLASTSVVVSITGGPNGTAGAAPSWGGTYTTGSGGSAGKISAITLPAGSGNYTIKVYMSNCSSPTTYRSGTYTVSAASATVSATLNFSVSAASCPLTLP